MRTDIAELWAVELESGRKQQGKLMLRMEVRDGVDEYCCLGVLCELAREAGVPLTVEKDDAGGYAYNSATAYLPGSVIRWAGMRNDTGTLSGEEVSLVNLNDTQRKSFAEIAQVIRAHAEEL